MPVPQQAARVQWQPKVEPNLRGTQAAGCQCESRTDLALEDGNRRDQGSNPVPLDLEAASFPLRPSGPPGNLSSDGKGLSEAGRAMAEATSTGFIVGLIMGDVARKPTKRREPPVRQRAAAMRERKRRAKRLRRAVKPGYSLPVVGLVSCQRRSE